MKLIFFCYLHPLIILRINYEVCPIPSSCMVTLQDAMEGPTLISALINYINCT